jgi:hypothetical protein
MRIADMKHYQKIHQWLRRNLTKTGVCSNCNQKTRTDWSLIQGYTYEKNPEYFKELCKSCHIKYDFTEITRQKMSLRMKSEIELGVKNPSTNKGKFGGDSHHCVAVEKLDKDMNLLCSYQSITEAAKDVNVTETAITNCIKGRSKSSAGYLWKYKNEGV